MVSAKSCTYGSCTGAVVKADPNEKIDLCADHRLVFIDFCKIKVKDSDVPEEVSWFIFLHPDGCSKREAGRGIGNRDYFISGDGKDIAYEPDPSARLHILTQASLIQGAIRLYSWISTCKLARRAKLLPSTVKKYALEGALGQTWENEHGYVYLRIRWLQYLSQLRKICKEKAKKNSSAKLNLRPRIRGMISIQEIADAAHVTARTVGNWIEQFGLEAQKIGRYWYIPIDEFFAFLKKAIAGKLDLKPKTVNKLRVLYSEFAARKRKRAKQN